jgi:hypothetical protein
MLEFLIDNIFVVVDGQDFEQSVGIPMGTSSAHLLADLFLYSYEAEFIHKLHGKKKSIRHFYLSTVFYLLTTINSIHMSIQYISMSWKSKTPQSVPHLLHI